MSLFNILSNNPPVHVDPLTTTHNTQRCGQTRFQRTIRPIKGLLRRSLTTFSQSVIRARCLRKNIKKHSASDTNRHTALNRDKKTVLPPLPQPSSDVKGRAGLNKIKKRMAPQPPIKQQAEIAHQALKAVKTPPATLENSAIDEKIMRNRITDILKNMTSKEQTILATDLRQALQNRQSQK